MIINLKIFHIIGVHLRMRLYQTRNSRDEIFARLRFAYHHRNDKTVILASPLCCIGQRIVWQFRDKVIYLLSIYSQIRIFIEYGNKDTANT